MGLAKVWVFAEADDDKPVSSTLELLTKAREIADAVECVYVGTNADALAPALGEYGVGKVHAVDGGEVLAGVTGAAAMAALVDEHQPDLILFAQTYDGRDAVARLSVKLDRPVLTNGVSIAVIVFALLSGMISSSKVVTARISVAPAPAVREIGDQLMGKYILPLEVIGLLLTAALIGAVIIAMREKEGR